MAFFSKKPPEPPAARQAPMRNGAAKPTGGDLRNGAAGAAREMRNGAAARPAPPTPPTAEEVKTGMERARKTLIALGEIVSVLMRAPEYRTASLASIQTLVGPAISSGQFMVLSAHDKARGVTTPAAIALWANVSAEVDRRMSDDAMQSPLLKAEEWTSGQIAWLVVLTGDKRMLPSLLSRLQQTKLKDRAIKVRLKGDDGKLIMRTLPPAKAQAENRAS